MRRAPPLPQRKRFLPFGFRWAQTVSNNFAKGFQMTTYTAPRFDPQKLWPILPFGFDRGVSTEADALVSVSADGVDLNSIWEQVSAAIGAWNADRSALTSLLTFSTTNSADAIPQAASSESFEVATEFGQPESLRAPTAHLLAGYTFEDYDLATRWSWKFLRNATKEQILAQANYALEADNKLVAGTILQRLFDNTTEQNEWAHTVYPIFNGDSGVPLDYLGKSFTAPHNHFLVSGSDVMDSGDLEQAAKLVTEHGFGTEVSSRLLAFVNPAQAEIISTFRAGVQNNNDQIAKHYIPSQGSPAYLQPENIVGQVAPAQFNGLAVQGSYSNVWIVASDYIPEDYLAVLATYGPNSPSNLMGFREHVQAPYRGLRRIPGPVAAYPIQEAFFSRSFGVGVRRRGQAAVVQIKAAGNYDVPAIPT